MKQEMKKTLLSTLVLAGVLASAQVGINTEDPKAMLDIRGANGKEGNLRIEDVKNISETNYSVLVWSENDKTVKRAAISEIIWDSNNKDRIAYIKGKHPDKAENIIEKIKQCEPENRIFDKKFGDGSHDFVYCAVSVNTNGYKKTWLNTNLGAEYSKVGSSDFNISVRKTGDDAHSDAKLYGSYLTYEGAINACPAGYHVPTKEEWEAFNNVITGSYSGVSNNKMWIQTQLPNFAAAGYRDYSNGSLDYAGSSGYYWSSTTSDSNTAYNMSFYSSLSYPSNYNSRSDGFSVRCLKD